MIIMETYNQRKICDASGNEKGKGNENGGNLCHEHRKELTFLSPVNSFKRRHSAVEELGFSVNANPD